ncbi:RecX family transcriptional regulator [soil metagenome]
MRSSRSRTRPTPPTSGTITRISPQRSSDERVNIFLDGTYAFSLSVQALTDQGVNVGLRLEQADISRLQHADEPQRAITAALHLLSHRGRSEHELRQRLRQKGFTADAIDATITRVIEWGYLNDEQFASSWVEQRSANRPRSRRALQHELREKGVDREIIASTIDNADIDELLDARQLAAGKWRKDRDLPLDKRRQRTAGFLARRGYGWDIARQVLDDLGTEDGET